MANGPPSIRKEFGEVLERRKNEEESVTTEATHHGNKSKNLADPK